MTLAVGAACEQGSILLSDSLTQRYRPDGVIECSQSADLKIGVLEGAQLAYVYSGACDGSEFQDFDGSDFVSDARRLFQQRANIRALVPAGIFEGATELDGSPATEREMARVNAHELIVAPLRGVSDGLGLLTDDGERWLTRSGVLVAGAAHAWWANQLVAAPRDIGEAECLALGIAWAFQRYCYKNRTFDEFLDDYRRDGTVTLPPLLPPYHCVRITAEGVTRWSTFL